MFNTTAVKGNFLRPAAEEFLFVCFIQNYNAYCRATAVLIRLILRQ